VPGSTIGVSGGGGEPRFALVVEFEAVEANRLTPWSFIVDWLLLLPPPATLAPVACGCGTFPEEPALAAASGGG